MAFRSGAGVWSSKSVGTFVEKRYACAEDTEQVKRALAKLVKQGELPKKVEKSIRKSKYYQREIQPIEDKLTEDDEDAED